MSTPTIPSDVAHDLRTPLNAIIGMAQLLMEPYFGTLTERQREYVRDIHGSGRELLALVDRLAGAVSHPPSPLPHQREMGR